MSDSTAAWPAGSAERSCCRQALAAVAERLHPCPIPDVLAGEDLCPCGDGAGWPCPSTEAAWLARGLDPGAEARRLLRSELLCGADVEPGPEVAS